jgi:hypothetical protein
MFLSAYLKFATLILLQLKTIYTPPFIYTIFNYQWVYHFKLLPQLKIDLETVMETFVDA